MKSHEFKTLGVLSAHLGVPAFLVEVNEDATIFVVHDVSLLGRWTREMDRAGMKQFVESLG